MRYHVYGNLADVAGHRLAVLRLWWGLEQKVAWHSCVTQRDASPLWDEKPPEPVGEAWQNVYSAQPLLWDSTTQAVLAEGTHDIAQRWRDLFPEVPAPAEKEELWSQTIDKELWESLRLAGFAAKVEEYKAGYHGVSAALSALDDVLDSTRFLSGSETPGLADAWLFSLLVRFDVVFYGLYKCNPKRIVHYRNLSPYLRDVYQSGRTAETVEFSNIKTHFYWEEERINPKRIVPVGGEPNLNLYHNRAQGFEEKDNSSVGTEEAQGKQRAKGEWVRPQSLHRSWITHDGSSDYPAESGRYHLYIANNCPWCHRVALTREVKGLQDVISMDVLYYRRDPKRGWQFNPAVEGCTPDTVNGVTYIQELYERVGSTEKSVPVLWDKQTQTIVNNESAEIIRMLNRAFNEWASADLELVPPKLESSIDEWNAFVYQHINNGAYKAGFASTQGAYELGYQNFFAAMERLECALFANKFLCGEQVTEADIRLFPTLYRFDHVYYTRFRLNHKMLREYPSLFRWFQDMLKIPGVQESSNLEHCRQGYFGRTGNNMVPVGPSFDLEQPMPVF
ncbi:MAG: hypothetical protein EP343_28835 [Deltaproteobacteria bacterium]|nr:MAG: hypothetical protein EP343_28835 [Deltaproteobacteria bacterium]